MNIGMGIGDWGFGDWGLGPIPNPQSPIPNPQSPYKLLFYFIIKKKYSKYLFIINLYLILLLYNNNIL